MGNTAEAIAADYPLNLVPARGLPTSGGKTLTVFYPWTLNPWAVNPPKRKKPLRACRMP